MISILKTLALIIVLAGLGLSGFWLGQNGKALVSPQPKVARSIYLPAAPTLPKPQEGPYAASPMVAPLARTVWANDLDENEGTIIATLPLDQATEIAKGQEIIFYTRKENELLPVVASVDSVESDDIVTRVSFLKPDKLPVGKVKARIITAETVGSKQLPISSLFQDDQGNNFVFKLSPANDGEYAALYQPVFAGFKGDDYFEVGPEIQMGEIVLANPPAGLQNGDTLAISTAAITPSLEPLAEQARNVQRQINTSIVKEGVQAFENALGPAASCNAQVAPGGLPADITSASGTITPAPASMVSPAPVTPKATDAPAAAITAPSSGGGCNSCGSSTY